MKKTEFSQGELAIQLGVTREHLNRVLRGRRPSKRLLKAYRALVGQPSRLSRAPQTVRSKPRS